MTVDEYVAGLDARLHEIATELAARLSAALPHASAEVWHGHPVWLDGKNPLAGFKAHPRWVTVMVWGEVSAASGLEQGPRMGTAKLTTVDDLARISLD
jgi:hypothetical protein